MDEIEKQWRNWPLKNTLFLIIGLIVFFMLVQIPQVDNTIKGLGNLGYFGALIAGMLFVSTYTVVPAAYVLYELAKNLNPLEIALIAAAGAMLGDYIIFRFIKDKVIHELKPYMAKLGHPKLRQLFATPYFAWLVPLSGAFIIASPLPDELGVSLMGASKMKNTHFLIFAYLLNAVGILFVVLLAKSI